MGGVRKIAFHVPSKIEPRPPDVSTIISTTTINVSPQLPGKSSHDQQEEFEEEKAEEEEEEEEEEKFISSEELAQNRLSDRGVVDVACPLLLIYSLHSSFPPSLRPSSRDAGDECVQRVQPRRAFSQTLHQKPVTADH